MEKQKRKSFLPSRVHARLFVAIVAILAVCFGIISIAAEPVLSYVLVLRTAGELTDIAEEINQLSPGSSSYYFELYSISVNNNVSFELISSTGTVNYQSSRGTSAQSSEHWAQTNSVSSEYDGTEPIQSYKVDFSAGKYEKRRKIATDAEYLVYSLETDTAEILHIFSPVAAINSNVKVATRVFTLISFGICLIMLVFIYIYSSLFTKPLVEMSDVTKDMADLDFHRRCQVRGNDEIGDLGRSINALSAALDSALMDLREKNEQLEKDIRHREELDKARREFINNVSHELKTPIAIISGYAEGLSAGLSDDPAVIHEYCQIISDESKKMNQLVVSLLELSKLESKNIEIHPENYCISDQISDVLSHFAILFDNHSLTVHNNVPAGLMCRAQPDKIEIVIKNYISNAVSHCSDKGNITLSCDDRNDKWRIGIFNTGSNIAEEDMANIWQSFYRADKAHERSENRFGLGLSIVQAIMKNHGTECGVQNTKTGVLFWFDVFKE